MNNEKKKEKKKEKKVILKILFPIIGMVALIILIFLTIKFILPKIRNEYQRGATTSYNEVVNLINNGEENIIYYYNSKSSNKYNKEIKKYLNELKINYYAYDDAKVTKEEYKKFLNLLNIPENVFGMPAVIYIKNGKMQGNIINIDSKEVVKRFIDDYNLYTVK